MVKRTQITLLFIIITFNFVYAQDRDSIIGLGIAEIMPQYKGGMNKMEIFIDSLLSYPKTAIKDSIEGEVYISFIVDTTGKTINHKIVKGVRNDLNQEALRVAKLIHFFKPAYQRGKPVAVEYNIKISFKIPP